VNFAALQGPPRRTPSRGPQQGPPAGADRPAHSAIQRSLHGLGDLVRNARRGGGGTVTRGVRQRTAQQPRADALAGCAAGRRAALGEIGLGVGSGLAVCSPEEPQRRGSEIQGLAKGVGLYGTEGLAGGLQGAGLAAEEVQELGCTGAATGRVRLGGARRGEG
jgi:hypothetical protein